MLRNEVNFHYERGQHVHHMKKGGYVIEDEGWAPWGAAILLNVALLSTNQYGPPSSQGSWVLRYSMS